MSCDAEVVVVVEVHEQEVIWVILVVRLRFLSSDGAEQVEVEESERAVKSEFEIRSLPSGGDVVGGY